MSELRRRRQLEEENRKLKQLVADLSLDKIFGGVLGKENNGGMVRNEKKRKYMHWSV